MKTPHLMAAFCSLLLGLSVGHPVWADVLNMGGTRNANGSWTGLASLETVPVGDAGNAPDTRYATPGYGAVAYNYHIGKYEVTAGQYTEFLNAVAGVDTYGLYNTNMWSSQFGCKIQRTGGGTAADPYVYSVGSDWANRPVNYLSFWDACRFANWLHNGQPSGIQNNSSTEDGAYTLTAQAMSNNAVSRNANWKWAVPSEDEWYKAAYYRPTLGTYFDYPTSSSTIPGYVNNRGTLSGTGTAFQEGGTDPGNYATYDDDDVPFGLGSPYGRSVVGEWEMSASPHGTFDQGANLWEWNEAVMHGLYRCVRGGSFASSGLNMRALDGYTYGHPAVDTYFGSGFRLVQAVRTGDVDGDGRVDVVDLLFLVDAFGSMTGDANYDARCDFNQDAAVDVADLLDLVYNFGT